MKEIKRIFKRGHSVECSLAKYSGALSRAALLGPLKIAVVHGLCWLISAMLMFWAALYANEQLAVITVLGNIHDIFDTSNENIPPTADWSGLIDKTYAFIEYCIILYMLAAAVFFVVAIYKVVCSLYAYVFSLESKFSRALANDELSIHYQPIVNMKTGMWIGAEALLRWTYKDKAISPALFVPLIERSGLMPLTTRWICRQVSEDYSRMIWACDNFYISVNLSAQDVLDPTFADFIEQLLAQYKMPASRMVFEVTEGVLLDKQRAIVQLDRLRANGHKIALDDFGTGYSNLSYLDCLPLDIIKIDRSFVAKQEAGPANMVLAHVFDMAWHLNLQVIVEGVETPAQVKRLLVLGALTGQGWFYSKDLAAAELVNGYFSLVHPTMNRVI